MQSSDARSTTSAAIASLLSQVTFITRSSGRKLGPSRRRMASAALELVALPPLPSLLVLASSRISTRTDGRFGSLASDAGALSSARLAIATKSSTAIL